ncbi:HEAT repeat-containing protein 6-like isoform X2 [Bombyx mandarina]|uniref:HEAT repeat-containing protein 6-like isoform X2 n=1 Tax=Bombyx mandarina TaxID=7092 RepID=A0A6J2KBU8_BOMMA|nr:HEAT repeat-containing protein 6-like isoform X2 [Bombyx mandarina]
MLLLGDVLCEMLQHEHQDVVVHAAKTVSVIGDAVQKLEQTDQAPPLTHCVQMWEKLITPLSNVLQSNENSPAKAVACDCIANIGEKSFKELPRRFQLLCCALLVGSCSDEEASVRAAAVRALAMAVMFKTLREDIHFVSDCGENILRALAEPTLVVRAKAAWALGNLSDALVLNLHEPDADEVDDDLLVRLLEVSIHCAVDNDKSEVFSNLCKLTKECKNLKVRINAAVALRAPRSRISYAANFAPIWRGVMAAMENAVNVDDFTEYKHKDNLVEQLCVTLAHLCCQLTPSDLTDILDHLVFHYDCAKAVFTQVFQRLPPENASCLRILQAAKYVTVDLVASNDAQSQSLSLLQDIFIFDF